jgi:hypothetical protein
LTQYSMFAQLLYPVWHKISVKSFAPLRTSYHNATKPKPNNVANCCNNTEHHPSYLEWIAMCKLWSQLSDIPCTSTYAWLVNVPRGHSWKCLGTIYVHMYVEYVIHIQSFQSCNIFITEWCEKSKKLALLLKYILIPPNITLM